jgi:squalene-associated FAD-dependent desaturase
MIVVIGGGWAGCAAAVELARRGHRIELHEAAAALGGRARCVTRDGLPLDNGEHLLLGAYVDTLDLAHTLRDADSGPPFSFAPLAIRPFAGANADALSLVTRELPAPLGLLAGLMSATGLTWRERIATMRWFARQRRQRYRCGPETTVATLISALPARVREGLWEPLCVAALNTPPPRASGQVFLNVLHETFGGGARATAIAAPCNGLAAAIPESARRWLASRGHAILTSTRTRITAIDARGLRLDVAGTQKRADAVVIAAGPHQLASVFAGVDATRPPPVATALADVARFEYEPITTIYLGYPKPATLPSGLLRLASGPGQWIFERRDILRRAQASSDRPDIRSLLSVVISAHGPHEALDHRSLTAAVDAQLRRDAPWLPDLVWSQVIEEKRATYACLPALARPACGRLCEGVYLAGDYTYGAFPATLEAAVRSGRIAARALARDRPAEPLASGA